MIMIMSDSFDRFFPDATSRRYVAGQPLFRAGDAVRSIFILRSGRADLIRHTGRGARLILHRAGPGQILAEASAWSDVYHCDAVAVEPCEFAVLTRNAFRSRLARDPAVSGAWAKSLARAVQEARLRAEIRSLVTVADRLDVWLGAGNELPGKGYWQDVAAELGVTREALYRELSNRRSRRSATTGQARRTI